MRFQAGSAADAEPWQQSAREKIFCLMMGGAQPKRSPLDPKVIRRIEVPGSSYVLEEMTLQALPDRRAHVWLARPLRAKSRVGAVLAIHGHGGSGEEVVRGQGLYWYGRTLAEMGYVVIAPDVGQHTLQHTNWSLMGERTWDALRCVDYLVTLPEVDPDRLGVAGLSLGGETTMYVAALDPRIKIACSSGWLTTVANMKNGHCACFNFPGLEEHFDFSDIFACIAPRVLVCELGEQERAPGGFPVDIGRRALEEIRSAYRVFQAETNLTLTAHPGPHVFCGQDFFSKLDSKPARPPNILWITAEDLSPNLGCYGDAYARTPHLDALASQGICYKGAFATAPVCSPARSCLITGLYATSLGTQRLRSQFPVPQFVRGFPAWLGEVGYFTANNVKTDYNLFNEAAFIRDCWNECSMNAHWRNRKPGQPFFAVFNLMTTHQSRTSVWPPAQFEKEVGSQLAPEERHDPARAPLPPYYPDTLEARRQWARYHDCITVMDKEVGKILKQLSEDQLDEDTIVFFYGDNGMGLPRGKRCLWDTGLQVPLLVRFPEKYRWMAPVAQGTATDRLVSFVDFAPTILSLCGIRAPAHMQGEAFLGRYARPPRKYVFGARDRVDEAFDLSRSVRDHRFLYIRNFMPHCSWFAPEAYSDGSTFRRELRQQADQNKLGGGPLTYTAPRKAIEELYDTQADPHQVHNLASSAEHKEILERLRAVLHDWMLSSRDAGFLTEPQMRERIGESGTPLDLAQSESKYPLARLLDAAGLVGRPEAVSRQTILLKDPEDGIRYWAAVGLRAAGTNAQPAHAVLREALTDPSPVVRIEAAAALAGMDETKDSLPLLAKELNEQPPDVALHAARALQLLEGRSKPVWPIMRQVLERARNQEMTVGDPAMFLRFSLESAVSAP